MADLDLNSEADPGAALVKTPGSALQTRGTGTGISAPVSQSGVNYLAMNVFVPGLGTMMRGKKPMGAAQLALAVLGVPMLFKFTFVGIFMILGAYIWSIATGVGFLKSQDSMEWR